MMQQAPETEVEQAEVMRTGVVQTEVVQKGAELRNAVRFPLVIPVKIEVDDGEIEAMTENISATGVLFVGDRPLPLQKQVRFIMKMPKEAMGTPADVVVNCGGRVVRCTTSGGSTRVAAVIDEYYFTQ